jgi:AcrR family transcriptional regulator
VNAPGARARVRAELTREIAEVARRHLATEGAAALSLRAVAREMQMASSAVYRYYPSRDDLLTALIIEAYEALGAAAEAADTAVDDADLFGRWQAICSAVRAWALAHPHEYALVYGSPVPGYAAPEATIGPAGRVAERFSRVLADGLESGAITADPDGSSADGALAPDLAPLLGLPLEPSGSLVARAVQAWTGVYGLINFELFGHTHNVVIDHEAYFTAATARLANGLGIACGTG